MSVLDVTWQQALEPRDEAASTIWFPVRDEATVRVVLPGARLVRSGGQVRVVLQAIPRGVVTAAYAHGYILGRVVLGQQSEAVGAEPWDFDGNQVALTFGGDECAVVRAGETLTSDPVPLALTAGRALVLGVVLSGHGTQTTNYPCVLVPADTGGRCFLIPGQAACAATAPRGLVEFFPEAASLPFLARLEVAEDAEGNALDWPTLASQEAPAVWDDLVSIPAGTELRFRVPAQSLQRGASGVRLVLQPVASESWSLSSATVGLAGEGAEFAGDPVPVLFNGQAGVTVGSTPVRSDPVALAIDPASPADLLVSLACLTATSLPRHGAGLMDGGDWAWWHRNEDGLWIPGDNAPLALAGLECRGAPATDAVTVYEVLGGNAGAIKNNPVMTLPAGTHVRLLLPRRPPAPLTLEAATQARLTLFWHDIPWTPGIPDGDGHTRCWSLSRLALGFAAPAAGDGRCFDFEAAPVEMLGELLADGPLVVDRPVVTTWFDLPRPWTPADRLLVALTLAQPYDVWHVSGGWQALWSIWLVESTALAAPSGGQSPPAWTAAQSIHAFPHTGQQPFVRRVEVRP